MIRDKHWGVAKLLAAAGVLLFPGLAPCQSVPEYSRPHSLAAIMLEQGNMVANAFAADGQRRFVLGGTSFPSLPTLQYMDTTRAIPPERRELIRRWIIAYGVGSSALDDYRNEVLFREDSLDLWLPVKSELLPHLDARLSRGDPLTLFVVWVGARRAPRHIDWVFLAYGFRD